MDYFKKIDTAGRAFLVREFKRNLLRRKLTSLDIWFNNECLRRHITPNYITFNTRIKSPSACKALNVARRVWIKEEVKKHYFKLNLIDLKLKNVYLNLTVMLHPLEFDILFSDVLDYVEDQGKLKFDRLSNKFRALSSKQEGNFLYSNSSHHSHKLDNNLHNSTALNNTFLNVAFCNEFNIDDCLRNGTFSDFQFNKRFLNLSSLVLDERDEELLNLGLKFNFNFSPKSADLQFLAVESERILESCNLDDKNIIRSQISVCLNKYHNIPHTSHPFNTRLSKSLSSFRKKISDHNIILSKADKGNCIVLLDKNLYIEKVENFLTLQDFSPIPNNPTIAFFASLKKTLSITNETLKFFNSDKSKLYSMNSQTPLLYGLPKIHKENCPIRPVVSYSNSPAYKLASWLNKIIVSYTKFSSKYAINNSFEFTDNLKDIFIPNDSILVSFDVKNLFPSIPPDDCIELLRSLLFSESDIPTYHILNLCVLVDTVLKQNFFQFNNKFYSQQSGLAMGSPLSPLLSEIFMSNLESKIETHPFFNKIIHFSRYVDDTFVIFNGTVDELHSLFSFLNSLNPSVVFTMELESDGAIPFLDILVQRGNNHKLDFSIYHKPTTTDSVIPYHSNHPITHKLAAFNSFFHRLFNIPLNHDNFIKELNFIKQIAHNNNYPPHIINKIYYKHISRFLNKNLITTPTNKQNKYFSLPFLNNISYKIQDIFRKLNLNISFKTTWPLKNFLVHTKDKIPTTDRSGVYLLACGHPGCNCCYIGQSGRRISTRILEHKRIIDKHKNVPNCELNSNSTFANHIINTGHNFDIEANSRVLHFCNKGTTLNLLEILEIYKALNNPKVNCINDQIQFSCLNFFSSLCFLND